MSFQFYANVISFMKDNMIETLVCFPFEANLCGIILLGSIHKNHFMQIQLYGSEDLFGQHSKTFSSNHYRLKYNINYWNEIKKPGGKDIISFFIDLTEKEPR